MLGSHQFYVLGNPRRVLDGHKVSFPQGKLLLQPLTANMLFAFNVGSSSIPEVAVRKTYSFLFNNVAPCLSCVSPQTLGTTGQHAEGHESGPTHPCRRRLVATLLDELITAVAGWIQHGGYLVGGTTAYWHQGNLMVALDPARHRCRPLSIRNSQLLQKADAHLIGPAKYGPGTMFNSFCLSRMACHL